GRTLSFSGKCHSRGLIEPRNQRAAKIYQLCNAQRSPKNSKNSAQRFFNNEKKPQSRPGKESCTQSIQEGIFLSSTRNFSTAFNFPSSFRTSSTTTAPPEGCFPPEHIFFWLECRTVFGSPFGLPLVDPNKNQEKIFFVQNDQAQYGREF